MTLLSALRGFLLPVAHAAFPPLPACPIFLPGCGATNNFVAAIAIPQFVMFLLRVTGALAVVMIVWYGISLIVNAGDEQKITKGRWGIIYGCLGLVLAMVSQLVVSFTVTELTLIQGTSTPGLQMNFVVVVLAHGARIMLTLTNVIFVFLLMYYGVRMILNQGKTDEYDRAKTGVLWTIIGAVFVNLAHAIVRIVSSFF